MTLSIDTRKVTWARVTPMDDEQTQWGIAWEAGIHHGVDRVGRRALVAMLVVLGVAFCMWLSGATVR